MLRNRIFQFAKSAISDILASRGGILFGRGTGSGNGEEIIIGSGLLLQDGTLSATGSGSGDVTYEENGDIKTAAPGVSPSNTLSSSLSNLIHYQTPQGGHIRFAATLADTTQDHTYLFPDRDGTVAMLDDIGNLTASKVVANAAARLALTAPNATGFAVVDADTGKSYMLVSGGNPATSGDWLQLGDRDILASDITDSSSVGRSLIQAADQAGARSAIGAEPETTESVLTLLEGENLTPTIYLSKLIVSDATGSIGYGATAPTGTDRTASIQAAIDAAPAGSVIVWDIAVGISAPILIPSDITIEAPSRKFGAILRAAANCPMFMNAGITTDGSASKQNTFGKLDPIYNDNLYRVFDPEFINNRNITIKGGTWNGNRAQQTGHPFMAEWGFCSIFKFWGVENVRMEGVYLLRGMCVLPVHFVNWRDVNISDSEVDFSPLYVGAYDQEQHDAGFQFNGPGQRLRMRDIFTHVSDDHIALNCNDSTGPTIDGAYGGGITSCVPGTNWVCNGDIRDVRIDNHTLAKGLENTTPSGCMRFLSTVHTVDDVVITNQSGLTSQFAYTVGYWSNTQILGNGNLGKIDFVNSSVELQDALNSGASASPGSGVWEITGYAKQVRILNRKRGAIPVNSVPDITIRPVSPGVDGGGTVVETLVVTGDYVDGNSRATPVIYHRGTIKNLTMDIRSTRPVHSSSAPAVYMDNASIIGSLNLSGYMDNLTNMLVVSSGTIDAANVSGQHTRAAGGSPLSISSGSVVTSAVFSGLSYKTANGFKSGAGTLTNSGSYTDTSAAPTVLDLFTGTLASALVGRSPAPTSAGAAYTLFTGTSANMTLGTEEAIFACNNSAEKIIHESGLADCTITAQVILDKDPSTFVIPFRVTDTNNQWQLLIGVGQYYLYKTVSGSHTLVSGNSNRLLMERRVIEVKIVMSGSSIAVYCDGVKTLTATDAFNSTATKHGMGGDAAGVRTLRCKSFRVGV